MANMQTVHVLKTNSESDQQPVAIITYDDDTTLSSMFCQGFVHLFSK